MQKLSDVLKESERRQVGVGHFNISDIVALRAIFEAARELAAPIMIGVSEGEREFIGVRRVVALVKSLREEYGYDIFLNADHTHSLQKAEEAAKAGFDEIIFDASKLNFGENLTQTKQAVEVVKSINSGILVEGEIGYIGSSSAILEKIPEGAALTEAMLTTAEEASQFVKETKVDVLAPAVGNMHGLLESMVRGETEKHLNIERIGAIKSATSVFLTLHGGSGTGDEDFKEAIKAGINIVHINTEIRLAWRRGVEEGLRKNPNEVAPYKILPPAFDGIKEDVLRRLKLFGW